MTRFSFLWAVTLLALAVPACRMDLDELAAEEAADSADVATSEGALLVSGVDDSMTTPTAETAAAGAQARAGGRFQPAGCATVTRVANVVTYVLQNCTGPFGLVHVTGTATATFTDAAAGAVQIDLEGTDVKVNRAVIDFHTKGVLTVNGTQRTLVVTTEGKGTGPRGNAFTRTGGYTLTRDTATDCLALDGSWKLDARLAERTTTVSGLSRCANACPAAGGSIVHTGFRGRTVTVELDGTSAASWSSSTGKSGTIDLACGG
jgi:hypothetical protein